MESNKQFFKRKGAKGCKGQGQELSQGDSPKMPQIREKKSSQIQVSGKSIHSPKDKAEAFSVKLPHIQQSYSEIDPYPIDSRKSSCRQSYNYDFSKKCHSNSSNLNKQNSWNSNFSLCSQQSSESPSCHQQKQKSNRGKDFSIVKQSCLQGTANEDPILRDLYSSIQAEKEIKEILNRKKAQVFKPPILFDNYQRKQTLPIQKPRVEGGHFSPPQRLLVNPIIKDKRFQMMHQEYQNEKGPQRQGKAFVSDPEDDYFKTNSSKASTTISLKTQELSTASEQETNPANNLGPFPDGALKPSKGGFQQWQ